jgi:phage terminase large subunit-like protein
VQPEPITKIPAIKGLLPDDLEALYKQAETELTRRVVENKLEGYRPYLKQRQFHDAGAGHRERLLMAGNQLGKSLAGGMECAIHATGRYPEWWKGRRFDRPTIGWACGTTNETVRDTVQRILVGRPNARGTGCIPAEAIVDLVAARGTPDLLDSIKVRHISGGVSVIGLKSYQRERESFQGETLDWCWLDEECPPDIYSEALTRTNIGRGPVWLTFTPLLGMSEVVLRFQQEQSPDRSVTVMTIDDVDHYSAEEKEAIAAAYPPHEREARAKGIPTLGSGRIFTSAEADLLVEPFECPSHWVKIGGIDFGWQHYSAFCELWHDRDLDIVYLARTHRTKNATAVEQAEAIRHWRLRWAWPHDGRNQTLAGAGVDLATQYRDLSLDMLHEHAQFLEGGNSLEQGLLMMDERMRGGRWKVFEERNEAWLEEYRLYHRDVNGKVVAKHDDALSASRYALMMLRFGQTESAKGRFYREIEYPRLGIV